MKTIQISLVGLFLAIFTFNAFSQTQALTDSEKKSLLYLMEEEKLARDVYSTLNEKWERNVFQNISGSEEHHLSMVRQMAENNSIVLPSSITENIRGEFVDPTLQQLYHELTTKGGLSLVNALEVGAKIEELDISDLQASISETDNTDLIQLYSNLISASKRHLRAFTNNLKQQGIAYEPLILETDYFNQIVTSPNTKGCESGSHGNEVSCGQGKGGANKGCCQSNR